MTLDALRSRVRGLADPEDARNLQRFFKTGPGQYGEGDLFLGIRVPVLRRLAKEAAALPLEDAQELLRSPYHEERLLALLILVRSHARGDAALRDRIHAAYLANTRYVNNWDLVDSSAEQLVGAQLRDGDRSLLDRLAVSDSVWERRIAIIATFHFIKGGELADTLRIAGLLLHDRHDLIHKAVGWMLREAGKRDCEAEETFLRRHCRDMPRTMLRYAVERFPGPLRLAYLRGEPASAPTVSA